MHHRLKLAAGALALGTLATTGDRFVNLRRDQVERSFESARRATTRRSPIHSGVTVVHVGDSHTVGAYGHEMTRLLVGTGAKVRTFAKNGATPSSWMSGGDDHRPLLERLRPLQPNVVVVSLGANFRGASAAEIEEQVAPLAEAVRSLGARLIWIGPPKTRADNDDPRRIEHFNRDLERAVAPFGTFIPSSPWIPRYVGSDPTGWHYWGARDADGLDPQDVAAEWADRVFKQIQKLR
jgi:hypothetical protein